MGRGGEGKGHVKRRVNGEEVWKLNVYRKGGGWE